MSRIQSYNLGQQMGVVHDFRQATRPDAVNYSAALNCWHELRQQVFPKQGLNPAYFGAFPGVNKEKKLPAFADKVTDVLLGQFNQTVWNLASQDVSISVYEREGLWPPLLLQYAAVGIVSLEPVTAFYASAAQYLRDRFSSKGVTLGDVIDEAIKLMHASPKRVAAGMDGLSWTDRLLALGLDPQKMRIRDDEKPNDYKQRVMPILTVYLHEALRLFVLHGPQRPSIMMEIHDITAERIERAMENNLLSDGFMMHLWNARSACIHSRTHYRKRLRVGGIAGLVGTAVAGAFYLFPKRFNVSDAIDRLTAHPHMLLFLALAAVAFGIMAFAPEWFVDE